jgi:hypothetical protein
MFAQELIRQRKRRGIVFEVGKDFRFLASHHSDAPDHPAEAGCE